MAPNLEYTAAAQICRRIITWLSRKWRTGQARPHYRTVLKKRKKYEMHKSRQCDMRERNLVVVAALLSQASDFERLDIGILLLMIRFQSTLGTSGNYFEKLLNAYHWPSRLNVTSNIT